MSIVIVEDEVFAANNLKRMLEEHRYTVVGIARSADEAMAVCRDLRPAIVLMDILLQGPVSGAEAALKIRNAYPEILVIFLTAYSDNEMVTYATDAQAFGYLLKPYREGEIMATLELAYASLKQRRVPKTPSRSTLVALAGGYVFETQTLRLTRNQSEVPISQKSKLLLKILCENRYTSTDSHTLVERIWGEEGNLDALRSLIYRLKAVTKIPLIKNHNRIGYCLRPPS